MSRTVVVVTDGYVGVEAQAFRFIRERLADANLFAFGIGSSVNRGLIEGMARAGQGEPFVVLRPEKAAAEADKLRAYIEQPVLTGVNVAFSGFDAYEVAPQKLPDLHGAPATGAVRQVPRRAPAGASRCAAPAGGGPLRQVVDVRGRADVRGENAALRWLWARRWVEHAGGRARDGRRASRPRTASPTLGLDYSLLTAFTSFVAVDSQVVNAGGQGQNVRQPLPMPEGVSNLAVSRAVGGAGRRRADEGDGRAGTAPARGAGGLSAHGKMSLSVPVAPAAPPPPGWRAAARPTRRPSSLRDDRSRSFCQGRRSRSRSTGRTRSRRPRTRRRSRRRRGDLDRDRGQAPIASAGPRHSSRRSARRSRRGARAAWRRRT